MQLREGFSGKIARIFVNSKLTPVIAIASVLIGVAAVFLTPKEEEPQISVPMIDIMTGAPGYSPEEVERKVSETIERAVWGLEGVEYVYSTSMANQSIVTVRYKVGEPMEPSIVKIHHKLQEVKALLPANVTPSMVKSFSIDDVPFLVLSFSSSVTDDFSLRTLVAPLARELSSTPDLSRVELLGGRKRAIRIIVDPDRLAARGTSLLEVAKALKASDAYAPVGKNWGEDKVYDVEVGGRIRSADDIQDIAVAQKGGVPVRIRDVATVTDGPEERVRSSVLIRQQKSGGEIQASDPERAVSIVFAKRKGTNVVILAKELMERAQIFSKALPSDVKLSVLRNYGDTAFEKSIELIEHLLLATLSVTILIALAMGWRAALVVAIAIPVTLALTIAIYYFMGYTLNRVTLFALIFSIGILVDDAIVVVENIERHLHLDRRVGIVTATLRAVAEVGNPTILATFTVVAAILPMAFVRGMMGPYMKPIPVGASLAMILSLFVAFMVTPWAAVRILKHEEPKTGKKAEADRHKESKMDLIYRRTVDRLLSRKKNAAAFGIFTILLLLAATSFVGFKWVKVKMLPFDNKNEFQVLIDYPADTPLEKNREWSTELAQKLVKDPEVKAVQVFAGEPAPFSFSGMVKHTFLRNRDDLADLQIRLSEKGERKKSSHEVITGLRVVIAEFGRQKKAATKVLEIPPGPPVLATMVAEVYGPTRSEREKVTRELEGIFAAEASVVDLDSTLRTQRPRQSYAFDWKAGGLLGTQAQMAVATGQLLFSETSVLSIADVSTPEEVSVDLSVAQSARSGAQPFKGQNVPSFESGVVPLSKTLAPSKEFQSHALYRKNLKPVSYVMSELAGDEEAPVYWIMKLGPKIPYAQQTAEVPWNTQAPVIKWDGEWFITYEVFRDLGAAFAVVMVLIYVLVLGWFKSYTIPLIIMAPIPISLIGILPGHAVFGAFFTATSMIGFIAGAGIIVRNSIILVDFIEHQLGQGLALKEAVISAGILRFRPMLMTAAAVVVGSSVMLFDPIFQGLAISLMFGEVAATLLSRLAVPVLYYWFVGKSRVKLIQTEKESMA